MAGRLNPTEYDIGELRRAADVSGDSAGSTGVRTDARDVVRSEVYEAVAERELTAAPAARSRPFLDDQPSSLVAVRTTYEWLDFLQRRVGDDGAREALSYYERIAWLSPAAEERLRDHLAALNPPLSREGSLADLDVDDHRLSYDYVTKLSAFAARERERPE
jgi:archaellum component FlaD/FlaE